jgi:hypothetical protein
MANEQVIRGRDDAPPVLAENVATAAVRSVSQDGPRDIGRVVPIDNLKAVLVAWVIAGHALLGYAAIGGWPYDEVTEVTLPRELELGLAIILGPSALFVIGTFFFLSGLLAPRSIARDGPAGFVRQRLLRLGMPWLLLTILVWPLVMWAAYRSAGHTLSFCMCGSGRSALDFMYWAFWWPAKAGPSVCRCVRHGVAG